ncbi:MAG: hypothetical protein QOI56_880 [Actinomycetota bacterium]|nr:hypothetical protein [Actinomycetota bacterium]
MSMAVVAVLLAAVTGASNQTPGRHHGSEQVAAGARVPAAAASVDPSPGRAGAASTTTSPSPAGAGAAAGPAAGGRSATVTDRPPTGSGSVAAVDSGAGGTATPAGGAGVGDGTVADGDAGDAGAGPEPAPASATRQDPSPSPAPTEATTTAPPGTTPPTGGLTRLPGVEAEVLAITNGDRAANGVPAVARDGCMDSEASAWARAMADAAVMSHNPDGGGAVQGCRGADASWGDNVGHWQPCLPDDMEAWWMGSPSHRPHILDPTYQVVGIGVWSEANGRCWFQVYFGS